MGRFSFLLYFSSFSIALPAFISSFRDFRLFRFIAPSNDDIRALMPSTRDNPRTRRKKRLVYFLSEAFLFLYPGNVDVNVSILWLLIAIGFTLQILVRLTSWLMVNEDERNVLLVFAAIFFLIAFIFTTQADRFFDIHLLTAYHQFCANVDSLMAENGFFVHEYTKSRDPTLLYVSISVLFSFIAAMLVFPNFRYANMYWCAQGSASKLTRLALHLTFLLPFFSLLSFTTPLKKELVFGPKKFFTEEQFDILRIYLALLSLTFRSILRKPHLQAHLNLSDAKLSTLQRQNGYIRNVALQAMIFQYYSYFCAAILQYFSPVLLSSVFALLLKTTGQLSWLGSPRVSSSRTTTAVGLASIFDPTVCSAFWSLSLTFVTFINVVLSLIGVMYNSYFLPLILCQICRLSLDAEYSRISSLSFPHPVGEVRGLAASPTNANIVASAVANFHGSSAAYGAYLWELDNTKGVMEKKDFVSLEQCPLSYEWDPQSGRASCLFQSSVLIFQCDEGLKVSQNRILSSKTYAQAWNPHSSGNLIGLTTDKDIICHDLRAEGVASCGDEGAIRLWDWRSPSVSLMTATPHAHWAWQVRFHPVHDQLILSAGSDATVVLSCMLSASSEIDDLNLDGTTEESFEKLEDGQLERIEEHEESIYACVWATADPWTFASLSYDGRVVVSRVSRKHKYALMQL
uniref:WD_REPEATS_REGION domain-containing protein n=2 Tax=Angiostrongylus cantonensis TaxID=6313 RepID=A0A0K0DAI1_ANGCA